MKKKKKNLLESNFHLGSGHVYFIAITMLWCQILKEIPKGRNKYYALLTLLSEKPKSRYIYKNKSTPPPPMHHAMHHQCTRPMPGLACWSGNTPIPPQLTFLAFRMEGLVGRSINFGFRTFRRIFQIQRLDSLFLRKFSSTPRFMQFITLGHEIFYVQIQRRLWPRAVPSVSD